MCYDSIMQNVGESRILRVPKEGNFTILDNHLLTDERLSWEARGLLSYLLSKPDDWQVRLYDLVRRGPAGEHKVTRILRELQAAGYLRRHRMRRADGRFEWITLVVERPSGRI
jgi:hypothetical protein